VGSLGCIANGGMKWAWGLMHDKFGFKICYFGILGLNIALSATIDFVAHIRICFMIWYLLSLLALGGILNCFPVIFSFLYGIKTGGKVYAFVFSAFGIATVLEVVLY
jgi:hypothetical protein